MRLAAIAWICLALAPLPAHAGVPDRLEATWKAARSAEADIDAAIEEVVGRMSWAKKTFARKKLKASMPVCRTVRIWETDQGELAIQCDGRRASVAPPDGRAVPWQSPEGDRFHLVHEVRGNRIIQRFEGERGSKQTEYALDGGTLQMRTTIRSRHLPSEVTYSEDFLPG